MTTGSIVGNYNPSSTCGSGGLAKFQKQNNYAYYFEMLAPGSVQYCIQTETQKNLGGCGAAKGDSTLGPGCYDLDKIESGQITIEPIIKNSSFSRLPSSI